MSYLLFAGGEYYPLGGADDLQGKFDSIESAIAAHDPKKYEYNGGWANILCLESLEVVATFWNGKWAESIKAEKE